MDDDRDDGDEDFERRTWILGPDPPTQSDFNL